MTCPNCGEENPERARFCMACATPLATAGSGAVRKTVTIVFSDLVDSTVLGEGLDPESLREVLNSYFDVIKEVLESHGGTVEKYIGDAAMAVFGLPAVHEDDPLRAVRAALEMQAALSRLNVTLERRWRVKLRQRTGVNTGEVVAGDPRGGQRLVTGDAVNVAARLEQAAASGEVLISEATYQLVGSAVTVERAQPLSLKGKSKPVGAYKLSALIAEAAPSLRRSDMPMVGRAAELGALNRALDEAILQRRCRLATVIGEAGIGKSRLLEVFIEEVKSRASVLTGRCLPYGESTTFWPLAEALRGAAAITIRDDEDQLTRKLADLVGRADTGLIGERIAAAIAPASSSFPLQETFWAFRVLLERLASERPTIIALDDLQWAQGTLLDLLEQIVQLSDHAPLLLLCAARHELIERRPSWTVSGPYATEIEVSSLAPSDSRQLVDHLLGGSPLPVEALSRISSAAEGNPLFLLQILSVWMDQGVLKERGGGRVVAADTSSFPIPRTLTTLLTARLDQLPPDERSVVERAAVIGQVFHAGAVTYLSSPESQPRVQSCLTSLIRRELIRPDVSTIGHEDAYRFAHGLFRDTAYASLLKRSRADLHERYVEWLLQATGYRADLYEELAAYHLESSFRSHTQLGTVDEHVREIGHRGAELMVSASSKAITRGDGKAAVKLLDRATGLLNGDPTSPREVAIVAALGKVAVTLGEWKRAADLLSAYADSGYPPVLRDLGVALCKLHRADPYGIRYREGQNYLMAAAQSAPSDVDAMASLAGTWRGVDEQRARGLYRAALDLDPADPYALGNHLEYEIADRGDLSPVHEMKNRIEEAIARCRQQADTGANLPWAFFDLGKFQLLLGRPYESLFAFCKAVQLTDAAFAIEGGLASLDRISSAEDELLGSDWIRRLLMLERAVKFPTPQAVGEVQALVTLNGATTKDPVVILTGGSGEEAEEMIERYRDLIIHAFDGFEGVVTSWGTEHDVGRLAKDIADRSDKRIQASVYAPDAVAGETAAKTDPSRLHHFGRSGETDFSPIEPLQDWINLVGTGHSAAGVCLIGIGGGRIASAEYRIALALGAQVGLLEGSGGEADSLLLDRDWITAPNLVKLSPRPDSLRAFADRQQPAG